MRVLLAEDEKDLNNIITKKLISEGYSVDSFNNGLDAIDAIDVTDYDIIILDVMMPLADGFKVLKHLRGLKKTTPVLFLTARDSVKDKVMGLDKGANDYMVKPFSFEELMARLRALSRTSFGLTENKLSVLDLVMDLNAHTVTRGDKNIDLSSKEFALLEYLMRNKGMVLTRTRIENHIWSFDYEGGTNVVDVYIRYLRKKVDDGFDKKLIQTVRGSGYVIREDI